nr:agmatinase [uncultured Aminipila sp.]
MNEIKFNTFMGLPEFNYMNLVDYVIIGIPFDTGCTFRVGARMAPSKIRQCSKFLKNYNVDLKTDISKELLGADYGDIKVIPGYIEASYERIQYELDNIVSTGAIPISLGGDHSISLAQLRVLAKSHGPIALIQFDSHTDTVDQYLGQIYNHATTFRRACEEGLIDVEHSIQIGIRSQIGNAGKLGFKTFTTNDIRNLGIKEVGRVIRERVGSSKAFLTFDIDFLDPAYAPGTGTIEVGGVSSLDAIDLIRETCEINVVGYDLAEVLPAYDEGDITSNTAAMIVYEFICFISKKLKIKRGL